MHQLGHVGDGPVVRLGQRDVRAELDTRRRQLEAVFDPFERLIEGLGHSHVRRVDVAARAMDAEQERRQARCHELTRVVSVHRHAAVGRDVDLRVADALREPDERKELGVERGLAAVVIEQLDASLAVLQQELALFVEVAVDLGARAHGAERAPVVALVGDVHDDLLRPFGGAQAKVERLFELLEILEGECLGGDGGGLLKVRPPVLDQGQHVALALGGFCEQGAGQGGGELHARPRAEPFAQVDGEVERAVDFVSGLAGHPES